MSEEKQSDILKRQSKDCLVCKSKKYCEYHLVEIVRAEQAEKPPTEEKEVEIKELFDMVYQWGKVGIVVDETAPAFRNSIDEIITSAQNKILDDAIKKVSGWRNDAKWGEIKDRIFEALEQLKKDEKE